MWKSDRGENWNKISPDYLVNAIFYYVRWRKSIKFFNTGLALLSRNGRAGFSKEDSVLFVQNGGTGIDKSSNTLNL